MRGAAPLRLPTGSSAEERDGERAGGRGMPPATPRGARPPFTLGRALVSSAHVHEAQAGLCGGGLGEPVSPGSDRRAWALCTSQTFDSNVELMNPCAGTWEERTVDTIVTVLFFAN